MKTIIGILIIQVSYMAMAQADSWARLPRQERCKKAGGEVASHVKAPSQENVKEGGFPAGPIDCTCGGKRFNPLFEGDICRGGNIMTAIEHYCQDSHGILSRVKGEAQKFPKTKRTITPVTLKCLCGGQEFAPNKTTLCENNAVKTVKDNSNSVP